MSSRSVKGESAFIGRELELAELRAGLGVAASGRGRFFLVSGEAGIGKTRIAEELSRIATDMRFTVVWGRCWRRSGAPAFWPWVQVIRTLASDLQLQSLRTLLGAGASWICQVVPELSEMLGESSSPAPSLESDHARFHFFDAATQFLKKAAAASPLLVVVDDLHWADEPSLLLTQFLARDLRDARIVLVATYREAEMPRHEAARAVFTSLLRDAAHIQVRGPVTLIDHATAGHPFVVDELLATVDEPEPRDRRTDADLAAPPRVDRRTFRREGDYWLLSSGGAHIRLKHMSGLRYLAELVHNPGRRYHVLELAELDSASDAGTHSRLADDRERLRDLQAELDEARRHNDLGRIESLRHELERVLDRQPSEDAAKEATAALARVNVQRALARALQRISQYDPNLARDLRTTIRSGTFCSYEPDPAHRIEWEK